jgi:hypothetical protein
MTKLTAAICCFALSGLFAWISSTSTASALSARAHATQSGFILMLKQPTPDYGIAGFSMFAAVAMLVLGVGCLIACMFPRKAKSPAEQR